MMDRPPVLELVAISNSPASSSANQALSTLPVGVIDGFAALLQISEKISRHILSGDQGMIVWWSIGAGEIARADRQRARRYHPSKRSQW